MFVDTSDQDMNYSVKTVEHDYSGFSDSIAPIESSSKWLTMEDAERFAESKGSAQSVKIVNRKGEVVKSYV